jgi:hypothetical protein
MLHLEMTKGGTRVGQAMNFCSQKRGRDNSGFRRPGNFGYFMKRTSSTILALKSSQAFVINRPRSIWHPIAWPRNSIVVVMVYASRIAKVTLAKEQVLSLASLPLFRLPDFHVHNVWVIIMPLWMGFTSEGNHKCRVTIVWGPFSKLSSSMQFSVIKIRVWL